MALQVLARPSRPTWLSSLTAVPSSCMGPLHSQLFSTRSALALILLFASLALAAALDDANSGRHYSTQRKTMSEPVITPSSTKPPLSHGAVAGIAIAAALAGCLVIIVLLAICVPSIRDKIGQTGVTSFSSSTMSPRKSKATEKGLSSAFSMDNINGKPSKSTLSERNKSTSSESDSSEELRARKIAERRRTQSMSISEPDDIPAKRSDDSDDSH